MSKIPIVILLLLFQTLNLISASPPPGLDTFLSSLPLSDPLSANDSFLTLPSSVKKSLSVTLDPNIKLHVSVPVYVKLAGSFSAAAPDTLTSFISAAISDEFFSVIGRHPDRRLSISHSLHLDASLSHLSSKISSAIASYLNSNSGTSALNPVPYAIVDDIVKKDYDAERDKNTPGFYIYLLNLDKQDKPYAYSYDKEGDDGDVGPSYYSTCLGSLWTGKERYIWIDLAAGPVDYGPWSAGDGVLPKGDFHALAAVRKKGGSEKVLMSDLGGLIMSAYKSLLVPSIRVSKDYESSLLIQFVHIHGNDNMGTGLDFKFVERTIKESELTFKAQELRFKVHSIKMEDCALCNFALTKSMSFYTSRFLFENYTMIVNEYLDSKSLRHILSQSLDEINKVAGIETEPFDRVLPVYVFDLDYDKPLLLDRFHQSVAFTDMVIAVRTRATQTVSDYACNGRHMITQSRYLNRPIVGSILQSMWGIAPTHLSWSFQHNETYVDYTWSVGQTPFGPFSTSSSLSFVQRDAAKRNALLMTLSYTKMSMTGLLDSLKLHSGECNLLQGGKYVEFLQRWNFLKHKLERVTSAMSHLDYEQAMYFMKSSEHDLYKLLLMVYHETQNLEASLVCFKDPPFPWVSVSVSVVFVFGFFYAYSKKDRFLKSKRKQF